jgi:hypothetical protein
MREEGRGKREDGKVKKKKKKSLLSRLPELDPKGEA